MNLNVLKDLKCSPYIIRHSKAVLKKARTISANFDIDVDLIEAGSILHDLGRTKTQGISHAVVGAQILRERGFSPEIVNITERHIGAGIAKEEAILLGLPPQDYLPLTLEEKIVAHADNLIHDTEEVNIDFVRKKWEIKLGKNHPSIERLLNLHKELFEDKTEEK